VQRPQRIQAKPAKKRRANALSVFVTLHLIVHLMFRVFLVLPVLLVRHLIRSHLVVFHHGVTHFVLVLHGLRSLLCCDPGDGGTHKQSGDKDRCG